MATRVILVRHGRSTFNDQQRYQGSSDASVLTEQGRETARQVGEWLRDWMEGTNCSIDAIYVSPLKRAQETLKVALDQLGDCTAPICINSCLREIDLPAWEGLSFAQVKTDFSEEYFCWKHHPHKFQMKANDTVVPLPCFPVLDLYDRAQQFWQETLPLYPGKTLLVVAHGGVNHALISTTLGLSPAQHHSLQQCNCGISLLEFSDGSLTTAQLQALNLTAHLGKTLPKLKEGKQGLRLLLVPAEIYSHQSIQQLVTSLRNIQIDFSLVSDLVQPQLLNRLLEHHSNTTKPQIIQDRFLRNWLRSIPSAYIPGASLLTGLVIAPLLDIQEVLGNAIDLAPEHLWRLHLCSGTLSVLHHPSSEQRPVLQTTNFSFPL